MMFPHTPLNRRPDPSGPGAGTVCRLGSDRLRDTEGLFSGVEGLFVFGEVRGGV